MRDNSSASPPNLEMAMTMGKTPTLINYFSSPASTSRSKSKSFTLPRKALFDLNSPEPSPKRKKLSLDSKDSRQMILDAGQKRTGCISCKECGMFFSENNAEDVKKHDKYHNRAKNLNLFMLPSNKVDKLKQTMFCVQASPDRTFFPIESDSKVFVDKVTSIIDDVVNKELGFPIDISVFGRDNRCVVWICVSQKDSKYFISCVLVSEILDKAYWCDSHEMFSNGPIFGINRVWTHSSARKKGIASSLIRTVMKLRSCKMFAISEPTEAGKKLALSLTSDEKERYLIYSVRK